MLSLYILELLEVHMGRAKVYGNGDEGMYVLVA
jgi:hypothetical protein